MTQHEWTKEQLLTHGEVTRNQGLRKGITRLGAVIFDLKEEGLDIQGEWRKTDAGKDFVYKLVTRPTKTISTFEIRDGVVFEKRVIVNV